MKFIKCLRKHNYDDYVGVFVYATKSTNFYSVKEIVEDNSHLFSYKVHFINATYMTINGKKVPVVVYHLGI